ncbi:unnamed protein product, partial [marine sediment metagenome]
FSQRQYPLGALDVFAGNCPGNGSEMYADILGNL